MKDKLIGGFGISLILLFMAYLFVVTLIGKWNILTVIPIPTIIAGYLFFSFLFTWAVEPVDKIERDEW